MMHEWPFDLKSPKKQPSRKKWCFFLLCFFHSACKSGGCEYLCCMSVIVHCRLKRDCLTHTSSSHIYIIHVPVFAILSPYLILSYLLYWYHTDSFHLLIVCFIKIFYGKANSDEKTPQLYFCLFSSSLKFTLTRFLNPAFSSFQSWSNSAPCICLHLQFTFGL